LTNTQKRARSLSLCRSLSAYPWDFTSVFSLVEMPCATAAHASARIDRPAPPSLRPCLCLHEHAAHERQQRVQGVEPGHLVGDHMRDAGAPRRRPWGPCTKLDHKGLIARERWFGWVHAYLPDADVRTPWVLLYLTFVWRRV